MTDDRLAAVVLLQQPVELGFAELRGAAAGITPAFAQNMQPGGGSGAALMFRVGPTIISVIWRNEKVPADELSFAVSHSPGWVKAGEAVAGHKAHALVMMTMPATIHEAAFRDACFVTFTAAAIARAARSSAVFWPAGATVTSPDVFCARAAELEKGDVPVLSWCNVVPLKLQDPASSDAITTVMTRGMQPFIDAELVHGPPGPRSAGELIAPTMDMAKALIAEGAVGAQKRNLPKLPPLEANGPACYVVGGR